MKRFFALAAAVALFAGLRAETIDDLPEYKGDHRLIGEIRSWGIENMLSLYRYWELGFLKEQRLVSFADVNVSPCAGIGALYTGVGDIAVLGREIWPIETESFHKAFGYDPLAIQVGTGSYDVQGKGFPMLIYVNRQNPIQGLTVQQLDGIFGEERTGGWVGDEWTAASARGADKNIRTWGQVGMTGEWAGQPIHIYGNDLTLNFGSYYIQRAAFGGGDKWNPGLKEFPLSEPGIQGPPVAKRGGEAMMEDVGKDLYGIGITGAQYGRKVANVRDVPLAKAEGGPFVAATPATCRERSYPLATAIWVYVNHPPGKPLDPKIREFLRYMLSRQGQHDIEKEGDYMPLPPSIAREQIKKLD